MIRKTSVPGLLILMAALSISAPSSATAATTYKYVNASTADQLVNAMLAAGRSRQPTTILLAQGSYVLSQSYTSAFGLSYLPPVSSQIVVDGPHQGLALIQYANGMPGGRAFTLLPGGRLAIRNVTLTGGVVFCDDDCDTNGGGAVENAGGELVLEDCVLQGNATVQMENEAVSHGGAIFNLKGNLTLERVTVTGNGAVHGGGLEIASGQAIIQDSFISSNSSGGIGPHLGGATGGGIYLSGGTMYLMRSTVAGNLVNLSDSPDEPIIALGGGIFNQRGTVSIQNSAINENTVHAAGDGGGIYNGWNMKIVDSTIGGNFAGTRGGGIFNSGTLQLQDVTIWDNSVADRVLTIPIPWPDNCDLNTTPQNCVGGAPGVWNEPSGKVTIANSVIANNLPSDPNYIGSLDCNGTLISEGYNAVGNNTQCTLSAAADLHGSPTFDLQNVNARLGALTDNGVSGNGHYPPLANSPLIDAGGRQGRYCTPTDQVGNARVSVHGQAGRTFCDIGAIEYQPPRR